MGAVFMTNSNLNTDPIQIQKLDHRFAGHKHFKYRISWRTVKHERIVNFIELRNWCWETFGPSNERDIIIYLADKDEGFVRCWSWHIEKDSVRYTPFIYLATDQEYALFKLKWM